MTRRDIEEIISSWTGIPVASLEMEEAEKLLHMEDDPAAAHRRPGGRDHRRHQPAIRRSRLGVNNPNRPMGSFIFLGPSGVGKTEVARRLAEFLFENQKSLVRFDMSEYMEKHAVSKLIGSPPGYVGHEEGGQLTERIRRKPYCVILFDEIEKAHPDIANLLLQILEDGILTDAYGNVVDFKNTLIIMTSNIGTQAPRQPQPRWASAAGARPEQPRDRGAGPEGAAARLLARVHQPHRRRHRLQSAGAGRAAPRSAASSSTTSTRRSPRKGAWIDIDDAAIEWLLAQSGDDPNMGARPLRRAIQKHVEDPVSELLDRRPRRASRGDRGSGRGRMGCESRRAKASRSPRGS